MLNYFFGLTTKHEYYIYNQRNDHLNLALEQCKKESNKVSRKHEEIKKQIVKPNLNTKVADFRLIKSSEKRKRHPEVAAVIKILEMDGITISSESESETDLLAFFFSY